MGLMPDPGKQLPVHLQLKIHRMIVESY